MPSYSQLLIPDRANFIPEPAAVVEYLEALQKLGAAPLEPSIRFSKPTGKIRKKKIFLMGKVRELTEAVWKPAEVKNLKGLKKSLTGLNEYKLFYSGKGPMPLSGFDFDPHYLDGFEGEYCVDLRIEVVPKPMSMSRFYPPEMRKASSYEEQESIVKKFRKENPHIKEFGKPVGPKAVDAFYNHPDTNKKLVVAGAGRARFWVTFEYGNGLFPKFNKKMEIFEPRIIKQTNDSFGVKFLQGFDIDL